MSESLSEAARVCLVRHHLPPTTFSVESDDAVFTAAVSWLFPDDRLRRAWANEIDTTEAAACCLALAAVELTDQMVAVGRAETRTGADFYLANADSTVEDFENVVRLEVSGVDRGDGQVLKARLNQKVRQAARGKSNLPALAAIIGFRLKQILLKNVEIK